MILQIVLWSNGVEGVGTTTLSSVLATLIAGKYNYKTLITHTMTRDLSMEHYLLKPREKEMSSASFESNVDGLFRLINNGKLTRDMIRDYCFSLLPHSNLDFLNTSKVYDADQKFLQNYLYLLYQAKEFYDVIVVDFNVPMDDPMFKKVLKESDVFIVVGNQNLYHNQELIKQVNEEKEFIKSYNLKTMFVLNQYNRQSQISSKRLMAPLNVKRGEVVSYQVNIADACNKNELVDFILRQLHNKKSSEFTNYIKESVHLVDEVMKPFLEVIKHG